jgi:hypothetical protein
MKYDVHIFAVVRVTVGSVEAQTQKAAIRKAVDSTDLYEIFAGENTDYAEEITSYLVDEVGDEGHRNTRCYRDKHHVALGAQDQQNGVEIIDVHSEC